MDKLGDTEQFAEYNRQALKIAQEVKELDRDNALEALEKYQQPTANQGIKNILSDRISGAATVETKTSVPESYIVKKQTRLPKAASFWSRRLTSLLYIFLAFITLIIISTLTGLIGTSSASYLDSFMYHIISYISNNPLTFTIFTIILIVCLVLIAFFYRERIILRQALKTASNLLDLDDSLLRLFASWIPTKDHENELRRILTELLKDAMEEFNGEVFRASILLPDKQGEYLTVWGQYGMPEETIHRMKFYIGNEKQENPRGVAGEAFLKGKLLIAHLIQEDSSWLADRSDYVTFNEKSYSPPYRSFAAVPIIGMARDNPSFTSLGVVCFDSRDSRIFDSNNTQQILGVIARRIAAALLIYQKLP